MFQYLLAGTLLLGACHPGQPKRNQTVTTATDSAQHGTPAITFDQEVHDFGTVHQGEVVEYAFRFKNTGKGVLLINDAQASCGCTIPDWPKEPIQPGGEGVLKVSFNSAGKEGSQDKSITLKANTDPAFVIGPRIVCNVVK